MSSPRSWIRPAFPDALASRLRARREVWFGRWLRRRGPVHPPLQLRYRQIFILPTRFGWAIGVLLAAMLLGSLNFNNNLGLLTTFLVAGVGLLSMHLAHRNLDGIRIVGSETESVFAGEPLPLRIQLNADNGRDRHGLVLEFGDQRAVLPRLAAGSSDELVLALPTMHRGWLTLGRLRLRTRWPLGWFEAWSWFWPAHRALVWPAPAVDAPPLPRTGANQASQRPGDEGDEFHGLRDWREGDPLHRIAWKASQRHDRLLARQFTRPERERLVLRLADAPGRDSEQRISVLTRWVIEADRRQFEYALELGALRIDSGSGPTQRLRCLNALAEHG